MAKRDDLKDYYIHEPSRYYKTVEELELAIDNYFKDCDEKSEPYTVTGLALALNFASRQALLNYTDMLDINGKPYYYAIKKAKTRCEEYVERGLLSGRCNATGAIFNLKNNFGWKDKQEIDAKNDNTVTVKIADEVKEWGK